MRASRFSEEQIIGILREDEAGAKTPELCRRARDLGRDLLHLWTAPPWQEGFGFVLTRIDCKHLSGITT
jgi:hypothetical protein